jgi:hypothetical protein
LINNAIANPSTNSTATETTYQWNLANSPHESNIVDKVGVAPLPAGDAGSAAALVIVLLFIFISRFIPAAGSQQQNKSDN